MEIPKAYDPKLAEEQHYSRWEASGYFAPEINKDADAPVYSIVIPPPNVTGSLHMGHALQHTIMDVLTRYHRGALKSSPRVLRQDVREGLDLPGGGADQLVPEGQNGALRSRSR
ncbi:MAG: class I tRNA ligase family protein [Acidobacteria bacterium]|nr:class I tRNA ligase family protein [Acidobacteriota bacterium]